MTKQNQSQNRRQNIRDDYWPKEIAWTGDDQGWFKSPRSLPLLLALLGSKMVSGNANPSSVYVDILSRHYGGGVVEMGHERDHAFASGYAGNRAVRTWQERVRLLETSGFIRVKRISGQIKYVLLVHPAKAVEALRRSGNVSDGWLEAYRERKRSTKEPDPPPAAGGGAIKSGKLRPAKVNP